MDGGLSLLGRIGSEAKLQLSYSNGLVQDQKYKMRGQQIIATQRLTRRKHRGTKVLGFFFKGNLIRNISTTEDTSFRADSEFGT